MAADVHDPIAWIAGSLGPDGRCLLMPNGGNLGDCLIASATIQRLERSGIRWALMRGQRATAKPGDVLAFGGGGSLVPLYEGGRACVASLLELGLPLVVLPQSIHGHAELWSQARNVTVFCRDVRSLKFMRAFPHLTSLPAHDLATELDLTADPFTTARSFRIAHARRGGERVLRAFRSDSESAFPRGAASRHVDAIDLAALASPSMESVTSIHAHSSAFLSAVATYDEIRTDRLHTAVAGGLLEIPTTLHDNAYGKNRAVFEMTLEARFPSIRWSDRRPEAGECDPGASR